MSDVDWTLLIDGPSDSTALISSRPFASASARRSSKSPAASKRSRHGLSHELIHHIAGTHDTNQNLTRRLLLLFESFAVTAPIVRQKVIRNVLDRYVTHNIVAPALSPPKRVIPHFLLNDVVRYWRTMASD